MTRMRGVARAFDRITVYLPVILMGVLALGTYWLARNTPVLSPAAPEKPATHDPDYFMRGFSVKSFDPNGRLKSELIGVEARHYLDTDTLEIDQVRVRSYGIDGSLLTATAKRGISNGDGSQVQLIGDAVVVREATPAKQAQEPRMEIRGDFLHAWVDTEQLKSNKPVTLIRGGDVFQGNAMDYDNRTRQLELTGNVHGKIVSRETPAAAATPPASSP